MKEVNLYRIAALDVGRVRIGIAMSDMLLTIASPYESYTRKNIIIDIAHIKNIIDNNNVKTVVIGMPISMNGSINEQCNSIKWFAEELKKNIDVPIEFVDERFTTLSAKNILIEADVSRDNRKKVIDKVAASFILQNYLDKVKK